MAEMAILIDVTRCTACRACQVACKEWNQLPGEATTFTGSYQNPPDLSATTWTLVQFRETSEGDGLRWRFRKAQCMHCTDAICHAVCPNDAVTKYPEGNVVINQERCQGCLRCVESCPFQVPHLNPATKKTAKCRGCLDRVTNGLPPACIKTCTSGALQYGLRARLLREALDALKEQERVLVYLRYFLSLSEHELADYMGCAQGTVKSRLHRALAKLREVVRDGFPGLLTEGV